MRALFVLPLALLVAAGNAQVFNFVRPEGTSTIYGVRGAVTVGSDRLTGEKSALEYNGTIALEKTGEETYLAKFVRFTTGKYDRIVRDIEDEGFGLQDTDKKVMMIRDNEDLMKQMLKPIKVFMKNGQVVRMEAEQDHKQWSLNIYRAVFTLLQNQLEKPRTLEIPHIEYVYENGIHGNCKVQYEIISEPEYDVTIPGVYNLTKTHNFKDCIGARPVYLHLKETKRGCAGVCEEHMPENYLDNYEEDKTDYTMKPTPGCPVNGQRTDTLVTVHKIAKYNISRGLLDEARTDSMDVYRLFGGELQVRTRLNLTILGTHGPKIEEPRNTNTYTNLHLRLPEGEQELDIPVYALMKELHNKEEYITGFNRHLEAVVRELTELKQGKITKTEEAMKTPAHVVELVQAISGMTYEEIKKTMTPAVMRPLGKGLGDEELLHRQMWIEILGKAGSKAAIKVIVEHIKNNVFTPTETRRLLQDVASFQSYPDTEMIEEVLELCVSDKTNNKLTSTGKATACVAAGKIISKACRSQVTYPDGQIKDDQQQKLWIHREQKHEQSHHELSMGRQSIKPELRCTVEHLHKYIERLSNALHQTTEFKNIVAYINGLAKIEKPEVLPKLIGYVNGTALKNVNFEKDQTKQEETLEFVRKIAIISLRDVAHKYPKEVNPIVRVIFENVTENVQTRILAFDVWMTTQPAQWQVEKVMQVANKDTSLELTNYVYTALKTAMHAKEPCYLLLAKRVRDAWTQIRPFDLGMEFSHLRSKSYYDNLKEYGVRAIWKMIASNTTVLPTYAQYKIDQTRGPFMKTLLGAKLLVKGGDKIWEELVGKDGLLERISEAVDGQLKQGKRQKQNEKLVRDIASQMNIELNEETPKAVLFWRLFSGQAIIPIDAEYVTELKRELLETIHKFGKQGLTGHFIRVFVPTKAFHVEPTNIGLPVVHSTIHPIVVFVRYENLKLNYDNIEDRVVPEKFELTGTIHPTILSLRQSRVFIGQTPEVKVPTVKVSNIKEANFPLTFRFAYNHLDKQLKFAVKPHFDRLYHSGHCTELNLEQNLIIDREPMTDGVNYDRCVKTMHEPIVFNKELNSRILGMDIKMHGYSHKPWSGLSILGSKELRRHGIIASIIDRLANKGMKHERLSLYLETNKQQPINEWEIKIEAESNIEKLAKIPLSQQEMKLNKVTIEKMDYEDKELVGQLDKVIRKVEEQLKKYEEERNEEETIERQMLVKIEGRYNGNAKRVLKLAMKNMLNFDKTEQGLAIALETESGKTIEVFANVSYPKIGSPFSFDPKYISEDELINGTIIAKINGQERNTIRIDFNSTKTEEQRQQESYEWFEEECLKDQEKGKQMTDACKKAILKDNSLDRMQMSIHLPENISPKIKKVAQKVLNLIKYKFYSQMRSEINGRVMQRVNPESTRKIEISVNATRVSPWSLLYDARVEMPRENITLSNIRMRGIRPPHMQMTLKQQIKHVMYRGQKENTCVLGTNGVRTFDNVTFGLDAKPGCEYILTRDCQNTPDFTVTFTIVDPETDAKKIRTQLVNTLIELKPFTVQERVFHVVVNGTEHRVTFDKPLVFEYAADKTVYIHAYETSNVHDAPIVRMYTQSKEITVEYDGVSAKVFVDNKYKGVTCGVCGHNNNEKTHEFVGPHGKEYRTPAEFIASYGLTETCRVPYHNKRVVSEKNQYEKKQYVRHEQQKWDSSEERMTSESREQDDERDSGHILKTNVIMENNYLCFSVKPISVCRPGYKKVAIIEKKQFNYACVEPQSAIAREAMRAVKNNEIFEAEKHKEHIVAYSGQIVAIPRCEQSY